MWAQGDACWPSQQTYVQGAPSSPPGMAFPELDKEKIIGKNHWPSPSPEPGTQRRILSHLRFRTHIPIRAKPSSPLFADLETEAQGPFREVCCHTRPPAAPRGEFSPVIPPTPSSSEPLRRQSSRLTCQWLRARPHVGAIWGRNEQAHTLPNGSQKREHGSAPVC